MKTISQIAAEFGVSVQTIYRMLNKVKQEEKNNLTNKINGIIHITLDGEDFLKNSLTVFKHGSRSEFNDVKHDKVEEIRFLREQNKKLLEDLDKERTHNREQSDKLADLANQLAEITRNNQILLGAEQSRTNPVLLGDEKERVADIDETPHRKKGLFGFFRSKK